jgi:hypothetical protein
MPVTKKTPAKKAAAPAKAPTKAPAKAAAKTAPAAKPAKKPTSAKPKAAASRTAGHREVTPEQRRYYVEVAAYYIAERHGFSTGRELADWTAAEAEIDRLLASGMLNP